MNYGRTAALEIIDRVSGVILGKMRQIEEVMLAFLANGHVLLEDIPGVGKTTLALAFSRACGIGYNRIQFTPDVLASDLTGFSIYRRDEERFVYQQGSVFTNLLLADEINRTSPKTQSALLEVMEERSVTVEGVTREVPKPFLVIATQNPAGAVGTQRLPEAQMDRFMVSMSMGYPDFDSELEIAKGIGEAGRLEAVSPATDGAGLERMQHEAAETYIHDEIYRYIVSLVTATRESPLLARGASPRATIALVRLSRASAWLAGRDYVTPADVYAQLQYVLPHRITPGVSAGAERIDRGELVSRVTEKVEKPRLRASVR